MYVLLLSKQVQRARLTASLANLASSVPVRVLPVSLVTVVQGTTAQVGHLPRHSLRRSQGITPKKEPLLRLCAHRVRIQPYTVLKTCSHPYQIILTFVKAIFIVGRGGERLNPVTDEEGGLFIKN